MAKNHTALKKDIIATCQRLMNIGYFVGTWGNTSIRVEEGLIITPSRVNYEDLVPDDFVTVSYKGKKLAGHRLPSSEMEIHRALYNQKDDIGAVIHTHAPYSTALACLHKPIPAFVEDLVQIIGGQVECAPYVPAGQHVKLGAGAAAAIGKANAVLLGNHGAVCCGRDLQEALVACQILEKAAHMLLMARPIGEVHTIPEESVRSERDRYLYKYGTENDFE